MIQNRIFTRRSPLTRTATALANMPPRSVTKSAQKARAATAAASAAALAVARAAKSKPQIAPAAAKPARKAAPVPQRLTAQDDDDEEEEYDDAEAADEEADEEDLSESEEAAAAEPEQDEDAEDAEEDAAEEDVADEQQDGDEEEIEGDESDAAEEGAEAEDGEEDVELSAEDAEMLAAEEAAEREAEEAAEGQDEEGEDEADTLPAPSKSPHALALDAATSAAYTAAMEARGVVYISRIPPYMKAAKLRWLLQQMIPATRKHGRIGRIFLTPEDASFARKRKKAGGNTGKKFVDGWVEFESKKVARWLAETYNTQPIGGPKRSRYVEDLWTLKYLSGFKWNHLTEQIAYEKTIRATKIREEISQAKRDSEYYLAQVERSNKLEKKAGGANQQQKRKVCAAQPISARVDPRCHSLSIATRSWLTHVCLVCSLCLPSSAATTTMLRLLTKRSALSINVSAERELSIATPLL